MLRLDVVPEGRVRMTESAKPRVEILVGASWTQVIQRLDEVRARWHHAREQNGLLELTAWDGVMLVHPDALQAVCQPVEPELLEDDDLKWDLDLDGIDEAPSDIADGQSHEVDSPARQDEQPTHRPLIDRRRRGGAH
jgi:hypothetical protein